MLLLAVSALFSTAFGAEAVLVPDFTPGTTSEFALAFMLQERVTTAIADAGHVVLTNDVVAPVVGALDICADDPSCPDDALNRLPARIAVVVRVTRREGAVYGEVAIHQRGLSDAVDTRTTVIQPGQEQVFADLVIAAITDAMVELGPASPDELAAARELVRARTATQPTEPGPTEPEPTEPEPTDRTARREPVVDTPKGDLDQRLAAARLAPRHIAGAERSFEKTELPPLQWVRRNAPHAGRVTFEIRAGLGIGDVDRAADVRVALDSGYSQTGGWFQEGPVGGGKGARGAVYFGYAPVTWMDFGVVAGLQYGRRSLTTGYTVDGVEQAAPGVDVVDAAQLYIDPMVRFYLVPLGIAKPYVVLAADFKAFDGYEIVDPEGVDYPAPPAGLVLGATGGGGLLFDAGPIVGFFAEGTYTRHFGIRADAAQDGERPDNAPAAQIPGATTTGVIGGVQFRI